MTPVARAFAWIAICLIAIRTGNACAADSPKTGPETEKRFPPLKVPPGFKVTLFTCDPLVEYPSAIALGPRPGTLFVVADFMTGLGTEIIRRDEIRLIEDTDGDGYADKATVYADGFNSIEGLTFHAGAVYAMHSPFLTALRDTDGDGKADERRDIVTGLGLTPEQNPVRLHCANGIVMGHDGWLYLALGDHGCDVARPEGDRLVFEGGGILRCRPDGRDLHVFASGLRNIYDVAIDADLNVFVRDNENDGGDYKIRVCHSFWGADHGYPYLYYERPDEALPPLADLGLGSSAGGLCYLEGQFPSEYHGNLIFCEWGRAVVRYRLERDGGRFAPVKELELAAGAENDPYGFKPTDLVVERDGSLIIADWADGQRPLRGRARIYRLQNVDESVQRRVSPDRQVGGASPANLDAAIAQLSSPSYYERFAAQEAISAAGPSGLKTLLAAVASGRVDVPGRLHAVWILARSSDPATLEKLFDWAASDASPRVRAQAVRAIADLADPVLAKHRLDARAGDTASASRLAAIGAKADPATLLEVVVSLGRVHWHEAPTWLRQIITAARFAQEPDGKPDPFLAHAVMQTLRRSGNWIEVLQLVDRPEIDPLRPIALRAIADQAVPELADGLIARLGGTLGEGGKPNGAVIERDPQRRAQLADALTRIHHKPGPWVYWNYRPAPRPANPVDWERTSAIESTLDGVLSDAHTETRLAVLRRMLREKVPVRHATLAAWLDQEREESSVAAILEAFRTIPPEQVRKLLGSVIAKGTHAESNRLTALADLTTRIDEAGASQLLDLARQVEDGPVAAELLRVLGQQKNLPAGDVILKRLGSQVGAVRAAAVEALAGLKPEGAGEAVRKLLADDDPTARRAAAAAVGTLAVRGAADQLLQLASDADAAVRRASLESLLRLGERRAVPQATTALADRQTQMVALAYLGEFGGPDQEPAVIELVTRDPSAAVVNLASGVLTKWSWIDGVSKSRRSELEHSIAKVQGTSGLAVRWFVRSPSAKADELSDKEWFRVEDAAHAEWPVVFATGLDSRLFLTAPAAADAKTPLHERVWVGICDLVVSEPMTVQFLASASGKLEVRLNGEPLLKRGDARPFQPDSDRFEGTLKAGENRLAVRIAAERDTAEFHLRFRRKSSTAEQEQFVQAALTRTGNPDRGRNLFFDAQKVQCSKCHRIGDQGEKIGPELTGIGDRFPRIHLVESILEPSRSVTPGFQTFAIALRDGRVLSGIKIAETEKKLTIADNQGQKHELAKSEIEEQSAQTQSTMPEGLVKQLSVDQFVDLIAFLTSQKGAR
ncbi:MAG: HEAT repeat domain-containing protein [Planctomycetia bacterium]|nr:HEAT repeat domain-containing protein [Planctomycetia bacterium]